MKNKLESIIKELSLLDQAFDQVKPDQVEERINKAFLQAEITSAIEALSQAIKLLEDFYV